jgi:HEAT repeat protein
MTTRTRSAAGSRFLPVLPVLLAISHGFTALSAAGGPALLGLGVAWATAGTGSVPASAPDTAEVLDKLLDAAAGIEPADSREPLLDLERLVATVAARPAVQESLARKLAARLASANVTLDAKKFFCWQLSLIGSDPEVPAIAPLLSDPQLSYYARLALERIPGDRSLAALRHALVTTSGQERVGVIQSLAVRSDARAVPDLAAVARNHDNEAAAAALQALGQLGGPAALHALLELESDLLASLEAELRQAQLQCAASLVLAGRAPEAMPLLEQLAASTEPPAVRTAAFVLWTSALGQGAAPRVLAALTGDDPWLRQAALPALQHADESLLASAAQHLGTLPPEIEASLLAILAERRATSALPGIVRTLASQHASVRMAAIAALGVLGDASTVLPLTSMLTAADAKERTAIGETLARLPGGGVDAALLSALGEGAPEVRIAVIRALRARASLQAIPAFTALTADGYPEVRREALRALGQLAEPSSCPALIGLFEHASPQLFPEIAAALAEICRRNADLSPLLRALPESPTPAKVGLMKALAAVGGSQPLAAIQGELKSHDPESRLAALRLLAEWHDPAPLNTLGAIALTTSDTRSRTLALRGLARLAPLAQEQAAAEAVKLIERAIPSAGLNEQRALLAALGQMASLNSLEIAAAHLNQPGLAEEARATVYKILDALEPAHREEVRPVLAQLRTAGTDPAEAAHLDGLELKFSDLRNLCLGARASNLEGMTSDGQGGPPSAAIDGNETTYWDEVDHQDLYVLRVDFPQTSRIVVLRIVGWKHHEYAPRDFAILADDRLLKRVEGAQYRNNVLRVDLPPTVCRSVELRITGYYGASPAIRELEVYGEPAEP